MAASKVLHRRGASVREAIAERIRAAAVLSYAPNWMTRSLRGGKTRTIRLVFESIGRVAAFRVALDGIAGLCVS